MKKIFLLLISIHFFAIAWGQQIQLKGKVSSTDGETLPGVSVSVQRTGSGVLTDANGYFQLTVQNDDILVFSYIGHQSKTVTITDQSTLNVVLSEEQTFLDEVVVVGYGQAKRITMTGAVSAISAKELRTIPTSSVQNALYGKLPGFFSQQRSGQPGKDASDFFIRGVSSLNSGGNQPLIIVDDVQYSYDQLQQININEIESISILKDASTTAIYGIKGANGVLVVKTRRGSQGKPQIGVRFETGIQMPVRTPKFLNSYETSQLVNEAYRNDGWSNLPFSDSDIEHFRIGDDPYGHPDVNWYEEIFKKIAYQNNANVDISGGTERLRYFITGGFFSQNGLTRNFSDPYDEVNTHYFYRRFNYRTNLDFDVTKTLNLRLDMNARMMNINEPNSGNAVGEIYNFSKMRPYSAPLMNPNGTYAYHYGTSDQDPTLNARLASEGYSRNRRVDYNILFGANQKLNFITEGLSATLRVAYASIDENRRRSFRFLNEYPTYHYDSASDAYNLNPKGRYDYGTYTVLGDQLKTIKDVNIQMFLNYNRSFNEIHNLQVMALYNRQSRTADFMDGVGVSVPENFQGFTGTVNYNFKNKYLLDFNLAYNGTDRFDKKNRYGFFPAVGVGYNLAEEKFFKDQFYNIKMLKIRASYGLVGSDVTPGNRYLYKQVYGTGGGYHFGDTPSPYSSYYEGSLANDNIVWEKARKSNIGIDLNLYNKISLMIDYFYDFRYDQLVERQDIIKIIGVGLPRSNVGETTNQGFDGQIGYQDKFGEVQFNTNLVFSFAKNKIKFTAEADQRYEWMARTGRPINQPFGYTFIGYYTPEDIAKINSGDNSVALPRTSEQVQAGDLKYKDMNRDGIIDDFDKGPIGKPNLPTTTLGWTVGGQYKGFSLSLLFQGSFDYSFSVIGTGIESFKSQFQPIHQKRWTIDRYNNGEAIEFPRLTTNPSTVNSSEGYNSDFWLVDAWYVRLKTIDLSYFIPSSVMPKGIDNARLYVNAYNLFTKTNYDKYQQDPEISTNSAGDAYMNQKVINLGIQVTF